MIEINAVKQKLNIKNLKEIIKNRFTFAKQNPTYFYPDGLVLFVGPQGSGKTLSAVQYVKRLLELYPKSKLVTNILINDYPIVTYDDYLEQNYYKNLLKNYEKITNETKQHLYNEYLLFNRVFPFNNADDLLTYSNDDEGVIYLIDEIHLYFNSLESKNINIDVMTQISQQRKQRKHIIGTSQVFSRMAKPLREQFNVVVKCKNYFRCLQCNTALDFENAEIDKDSMSVEGKAMFKNWFFHSIKMYNDYDTSYIIDRNKFVSEEEKKGDIYERNDVVNVTTRK